MYRTLLASGGIGVAVAFGCEGDWTGVGWAGGGVLLAACFWFYGELSATAEAMRQAAPPEPRPAPRLDPVPVPRVRREAHPPWATAPMPVVPAEPGPECDKPKPARWQQEARVRFPSTTNPGPAT